MIGMAEVARDITKGTWGANDGHLVVNYIHRICSLTEQRYTCTATYGRYNHCLLLNILHQLDKSDAVVPSHSPIPLFVVVANLASNKILAMYLCSLRQRQGDAVAYCRDYLRAKIANLNGDGHVGVGVQEYTHGILVNNGTPLGEQMLPGTNGRPSDPY